MTKKKKISKAKLKLLAPPDKGPKVLLFDIETAPIVAHVWTLWENNVGLNQIVADWHVLSWSAKWLGDNASQVMYDDQRNAKNIEDDKRLLQGIWDLLDQADIVITQNGKSFDQKKLNARFILNGFQPPSSFKHIDTKLIAKRHFAFTSNKLEYMTDKLCVKYKKLQHKEFPGHEMWTQCLKGNIKAWEAMEIYNKYDVLSLEELFTILIPWDSTINFNLYHDAEENTCKCGSSEFIRNGFYYTSSGKYQKLRCKKCGAETRCRENLFSKEKRAALKVHTAR
jgi:uncharacterized protein YprB with RNaseH-like and TPR domain